MLGMKKGGKRLLIIPPSCAVGSEGVIGWTSSTDSILVFEVEVRRVSEILTVLCLVSQSSDDKLHGHFHGAIIFATTEKCYTFLSDS